MYLFTIRGVRGTLPVSRADAFRYGGNTTCFSLRTPQGWLLVDAGTGLASLIAQTGPASTGTRITWLFTHFHLDHLLGLPGFAPLYHRGTELTLMADGRRSSPWREDLRAFMRRPFWPVPLDECEASVRLEDLPHHPPLLCVDGVEVRWFRVPHPQDCLAYRLTFAGRTIVIATDVEYDASDVDPAFVAFCRGADDLVFDAQYTPEEYAARRGWGHSTWETAVTVARAAAVRRLILTHHDPVRTDAEVEALVAAARRHFPSSEAASDNLVLA